MATFSYEDYPGDGSTDTFSIPFSYLNEADIQVEVDETPVSFTFLDSNTVKLDVIPTSEQEVRVLRRTSAAQRLVNFNDASTFTGPDINLSFDQALFVAQEAFDVVDEAEGFSALALSTAISADDTSQQALNTANQSISDADQAATDSAEALSTANAADTKADNAVITANAADEKADNAVVTADEAKAIAEAATGVENLSSDFITNDSVVNGSTVTEAFNTVNGEFLSVNNSLSVVTSDIDDLSQEVSQTQTDVNSLQDSFNGLGTASQEDVTTSNADTTFGRILKVGDFGLGNTGIILTDYDDPIRASGFLSGDGSSSVGDTPPANGSFHPNISAYRSGSDRLSLLSFGNAMSYKKWTGSTPDHSWRTLWDDNNLPLINNDITIRVPTDYSTVQEAFDAIARKSIGPIKITIRLESGFIWNETVDLRDADFSNVRMISDSTVTVSSSRNTAQRIIVGINCRMPQWDFYMDAQGNGNTGIYLAQSTMKIGDGCGIDNAGYFGLYANLGSHVIARNTSFRFAGSNGTSASQVDATGISARRCSSVDCSGSDVRESLMYGVSASQSSNINFVDGEARQCGRHNIRADEASYLNCTGASASEGGAFCVYALRGSTINARNGSFISFLNSPTQRNIYAAEGSHISARAAQATRQDGQNIINNVQVFRGSTIDANDISGSVSFSQSLNTITNNGIIYG